MALNKVNEFGAAGSTRSGDQGERLIEKGMVRIDYVDDFLGVLSRRTPTRT